MKWWIVLSWGYEGKYYSRFPFTGHKYQAWTEARHLARHYLQDRVVSQIEVQVRNK